MTVSTRALATVSLLLAFASLHAQQAALPAPASAAQTPQLSPKAAYEDAMNPLNLTRRSIANWSGAEVTALTVSIDRARTACQARNPHTYSGEELIDYARLCGLGQEWGMVVLATTLYIDSPDAQKPLLTDAHAARVDADLRLHSQPDALRDTRAMFAAVPYSPMVAEASDEAIEYMRFSKPDDALALASERQPLVLAQLKQLAVPAAPAEPQPSTTASATTTAWSISPGATGPHASMHELYSQGLTLASLQQLANKLDLAATTVSELDATLPATSHNDELILVNEARRRYALLGKPLTGLTLTKSLSMPNILPTIPATNTMTVLLLFPDWCAQCISGMGQVPETVNKVSGHDAYYYGLLAETVPEKKPDTQITSQQLAQTFNPSYAASLLAERPVVTVPTSMLDRFAATDFPFLIITDTKGIVRVAQPVDADDMSSGGKVDSAVAVVGDRWPLPLPKPAPAATSGKASASVQ